MERLMNRQEAINHIQDNSRVLAELKGPKGNPNIYTLRTTMKGTVFFMIEYVERFGENKGKVTGFELYFADGSNKIAPSIEKFNSL